MNLQEIWNKNEDEHGRFERVKYKTSTRADIHAFMLLDKIIGPYVMGTGCGNMVSCAEHDEIWLSVDTEKLAKVITEEQCVELMRCGVRFDSSTDSLAMFV